MSTFFLRTAALISIVSSFFIFISCDKLGLQQKKETPTKTVVLLCDFSESTKGVKTLYTETFEKILPSIKLGDAIIIAKITDSSITEPEIPLKESFTKIIRNSLTDNTIKKAKEEKDENKKLEDKKVEMLAKAKEILNPAVVSKEKILKTDIMSSLLVAENIFNNFHCDKNVLLICSDMLEDSSRYNFEKNKLDDQRIQEIISKEKSEGRLPNLKDTRVYVIAAGMKNSDKFLAVQNFWMKYFNEGVGAQLLKEHYNGTLISFEE
jgi:hypothetical protein